MKKITTLTEEYIAKDNELLAKITASEQAIESLETEYQTKLAELLQADADNEEAIADLDAKYLAKVEKLVKADEDNEEALATLRTEYETELKKLQDKDIATDKAIADLDAKYLAKVEKLQGDISTLTKQLETNKNELQNKIDGIKESYDAKFEALYEIIETLQTTDTSQQEIIESLIDRIAKLENANQIQGHDYGEWLPFGSDENTCEEKIFYRVCATCNEMQFKHGSYDDHDWNIITIDSTCQAQGYDEKTCQICEIQEKVNYQPISDHNWQTNYTTDNSFHWIKCNDCEAINGGKTEHTLDDSGYCIVCDAPIGATVGIVYDISADGTYAEVIGYHGSARIVKFADSYEGLPVKRICDNVFYDCSVEEIIIPNSINSVGLNIVDDLSDQFSKVTYLGTIDEWAQINFDYKDGGYFGVDLYPDIFGVNLYIEDKLATEIKEVTLTTATKIGDCAFYGWKSLTSIEIPDSVTSIGFFAFFGCSSLEEIEIPDGVTSIGTYAFSRCSSLESIEIPDSVTSIGYSAFSGCSSLETIYCEAQSKPSGWDSYWKGNCNVQVIWGYKGEN